MSEGAESTEGPTTIDLSKVLRLRSMLERLRSEVREIEADERSLQRLASLHNQLETELATAMPEPLSAELAEFSSCCHDNPLPSKPEIRVAQAQLIGWIEGLLQGVQISVATVDQQSAQLPESEPEPTGGSYNPTSYL